MSEEKEPAPKHQRVIIVSLLALTAALAIIVGSVVGVSAALNINADWQGDTGEVELALPSLIYDSNGVLVTEFFGDERRELISYSDIPRKTVQALLTREDRDFFSHNGFSVKGTFRAAGKIFMRLFGAGFVSGGSTLTQQLAGHLYANRAKDQSLMRKVRELWWAWQIEKHLSKQEILETYLNKMPFGHTTYGIQAASRYFFGHGIESATPAESVMLVIQLANPSGLYSPIRNPRRAQVVQNQIIQQMAKRDSFLTASQAAFEYENFWANYDWSRDSYGTAFFDREDKAPWFSEYIRTELDGLLSGQQNIYTGGFSVHTTLNLDHQNAAQEEIDRGLQIANNRLRNNFNAQFDEASDYYLPILDMLAVGFGMDSMRLEGGQTRRFAKNYYNSDINATIDIVTSLFGLQQANSAAQNSYLALRRQQMSSRIEAALVTIEQATGQVTAIIGGSRFDRLNQLNRAMNAKIMPGSAFKPLYYAEAIASGRLTAASNLDNYYKVWFNEDGSIYRPNNYNGEYDSRGVLLRRAVALSLNIPALSALEAVGFDAAIARSARLMGINDPEEISKTFPRVWSLGLGIIGAAPVQMARAFAVFPNAGREVVPFAIKNVRDRYGRLIIDVENDIRIKSEADEGSQIMSPQAAYIMTDIMRSSVSYGTFYWANFREGQGFNQPVSGKTGTSQNWSDAWAIGSTPYYTTAVWLGFDKGGNTLGRENEASSSSANIFMRYMKRIHEGLPRREFERPADGLTSAVVCSVSGLIPTANCPTRLSEMFLPGTEPHTYCTYHDNLANRQGIINDVILDALNSSETSWFDAGSFNLELNDPFASSGDSGLDGETNLGANTEDLAF